MNFKNLLFFLFFFQSCGVKGPPLPEEGNIVPSSLEILKQELMSKIESEKDLSQEPSQEKKQVPKK